MTKKNLDNQLFVIHKHSGPTSFAVVDAFRKASGSARVGHAGTLDPIATGVLLVCTGKATKAVELLMDLRKTYEFEVVMGVATDTLDADGEITEQKEAPEQDRQAIEAAVAEFRGTYDMVPPAYSAIKKNGRRSYDLARAGEAPPLKSRSVTVHDIEVTGVEWPRVCCRVVCSRGTYVRSIARDLGAKFQLPAHVGWLKRTGVGLFTLENAFAAERVFDGDLEGIAGVSVASALEFVPAIVLADSACEALATGACPEPKDVVKTIGAADDAATLRLLNREGQLLAIGRRRPGERRAPHVVDTYRLIADR